MILNDRLIKIGGNAHEALRFLRKLDNQVHLWIDTICIDQKDNDERNQ